jgi:hypothetical protein
MVKEGLRIIMSSMKLQLGSYFGQDGTQEGCSRATTCAVENQNPNPSTSVLPFRITKDELKIKQPTDYYHASEPQQVSQTTERSSRDSQ